jgi:hypothetical protein
VPLDSVDLHQVLHAVAEVVGHPQHHVKAFLVAGQRVLVEESLHDLSDTRFQSMGQIDALDHGSSQTCLTLIFFTYLVGGVVWRPRLVQLLVQVEHGLGVRREVPRAHLLLAGVENVHHPRHPLPQGAVVRGRPRVRARAQVVPCESTHDQRSSNCRSTNWRTRHG